MKVRLPSFDETGSEKNLMLWILQRKLQMVQLPLDRLLLYTSNASISIYQQIIMRVFDEGTLAIG